MQEAETGSDRPPSALGDLARLAAACTRPFSSIEPGHWKLGPLSSAMVATLSRDACFAGPIERALATKLAEDHFGLTHEEALDLARARAGRAAILLVSRPPDHLQQAALLCAAAAMQHHVLRALGRQDRQRLREAFGTTAYRLATQEAPVLYPGLAVFGSSRLASEILGEEIDQVEAWRRLLAFGAGLVVRLVHASSPELARFVPLKLPVDCLPRMLDRHEGMDVSPFLKLLCRRMPGWSAIIG